MVDLLLKCVLRQCAGSLLANLPPMIRRSVDPLYLGPMRCHRAASPRRVPNTDGIQRTPPSTFSGGTPGSLAERGRWCDAAPPDKLSGRPSPSCVKAFSRDCGGRAHKSPPLRHFAPGQPISSWLRDLRGLADGAISCSRS
jgi:hypothetical protein